MTAASARLAEAQARLVEAQHDLAVAKVRVVMAGIGKLAERDEFPPSYLRQLALSGPVDVDAGTVGDPLHVQLQGDDRDGERQVGYASRELDARIILARAFLNRSVSHVRGACQHLMQVVRELRVDFHSLAPSVGPDRSVEPPSVLGSASSTEGGRGGRS